MDIDQSRAAARRLLSHLLAEELSFSRGTSADAILKELDTDEPFMGGSLGLDSMEMLAASRRVADATGLLSIGHEDRLIGPNQSIATWAELLTGLWSKVSSEMTLSFLTSGSTGSPKRCEHRLSDLIDEANSWADVLGTFGFETQRVIAFAPPQHIYGMIWTVLVPAVLGVPVVEASGTRSISASARLREHDLAIGFPFIWRELMRTGTPIPAGVCGVTSTGPCPPAVSAWGVEHMSPFLEIYGSSEIGGIGWRANHCDGYRLAGRFQRGDGPMELRRATTGESIELPDLIGWRGDSQFDVLGRRDGMVQVGGINVSPTKVQKTLLEHPLVASCVVRLMSSTEGERLKAFIVPKKEHGRPDAATELTAWIEERLAPAERPKHVTIGDALPTNAMGKPADWPVTEGQRSIN